ncbi:MAG: hypothetical protein ACP5KW_08490 [Thermoproteota archaeon]
MEDRKKYLSSVQGARMAIRPLRTAFTREAVISDEVSFEEYKIVVIASHYRHVHIDYDEVRKMMKRLKYMDDVDGFYHYCQNTNKRKKRKILTRKKKLVQTKEMRKEAIEKIKDKCTRETINLQRKIVFAENLT